MKKGFTLVEIIISIGLILIVGVTSLLSYNWIDKKNTLKTLESMSSEILTAAKVYIETEGIVKEKVYEFGEGVVIPLNALVNEGLLDLEGTTLELDDLEDEYIVSALTGSFGPDDCIDITTNTSWTLSDDNPLYICTEVSSEEIEDLKKEVEDLKKKVNELETAPDTSVLEEKVADLQKQVDELNYSIFIGNMKFAGENPNNWVKFEINNNSGKWPTTDTNYWRILSVESDGSLKLVYNRIISSSFNINDIKTENSSILNTLYNDFVNKDMVKYNKFNYGYYQVKYVNCDYSYNNCTYDNIYLYSSSKVQNYIGTISKDDYVNSLSSNMSYIPSGLMIANCRLDYYATPASYATAKNPGIIRINSSGDLSFSSSSTTGSFLPMIVMKPNVVIKSFDNCSNGKVRGTKDCPFELKTQ